MNFNPAQNEIINTLEGSLLVSAPVGTGKTSVLTERVVQALKSGFRPDEILCLTFTNRAAEEMAGRIRQRLADKQLTEGLTVKTFHGFCAYLVRAEAEVVGVSSDFTIFDDTEQIELMQGITDKYPDMFSFEPNNKRALGDLKDKIYQSRLTGLERRIGCQVPEIELSPEAKQAGQEYRQALWDRNALDFDELVILALELLYFNPEIQKKWSSRYRFVQLDEFQDTHLSEYLVVKELAKTSGNIAFIGDLDQTIYSWRGSNPHLVAGLVREHFAPVREYYLETNYRFNHYLLKAMRSFLDSLAEPATKEMKAYNTDEGEEKCIQVFRAHKFHDEIAWVIDSIQDIKKREPKARVSVLARANWLLGLTAEEFTRQGIEHTTLDKYDFFRRQEIKDIMACLRLVFNVFDLESAYRLVSRTARGVGTETMASIRKEGQPIGLKVSDFLRFKNYNFSEPFAKLLEAYAGGRLVVFDTETTGVDPLQDEVIQIYAREVAAGSPGREFHFYLKNQKPVGSSAAVHGLTDEYLAQNGRDPKEVLSEFRDFLGSDIAVGHNVNFDISMTVENAKRLGLNIDFTDFYDTLDLSRRLIRSDSYRLGVLAEKLGLHTATHDAADDVMATVGLLSHLAGKLSEHTRERQELFGKYSSKFIQLAQKLENWRQTAQELRPAEAARQIWQDSGLADHYARDKDADKRQASVKTLFKFFAEKDDPDRLPGAVLREIIQSAALSKNMAVLALEKGRIPIVTVHQVKGLEFDYVFIVGANEYRFPSLRTGSDLEEEKRLFYVAMTRARQKVFISYSSFDDYGRPLSKSRFLGYINSQYLNEAG
jgi:DNA helicase-2/ATP-dependent DNA helicase PcrA